MKLFSILIPLVVLVAEISTVLEKPLEISHENKTALTITHCHPGDEAIIRVDPALERDQMSGGWLFTTNSILTFTNLSPLPNGTNFLTIQTVCAGVTSKPTMKTVIMRREPPAPVVGQRRLNMAPPPDAPLPWGMTVALPNAGNPKDSYSDFTNRLESGKRRSQ